LYTCSGRSSNSLIKGAIGYLMQQREKHCW
jgi:hypothetical protein